MAIRITQERADILRKGGQPSDRVTQEIVEQINNAAGNQAMRMTQEIIEQVNNASGNQAMRMTQFIVEVITRNPSGFIWNPWVIGM